MEFAQTVHLGSVLAGIAVAIWFRAFALLFALPLICGFAAMAHWASGLSGQGILIATLVDWVLMQIAYFLGTLALDKLPSGWKDLLSFRTAGRKIEAGVPTRDDRRCQDDQL